METGIGLTPLDSISKSPNQTTSHPTPTFNSDCGRHIRYYEKDGLITGFLQNELDQELTSLEKKDADALAIYLIKNKTAFSANKITTAISIEAGPIDVWLNQIKASVNMEQIFYLNDVDSMVEYFYSHSELSDEIDGLLLMQSLGYNTKTPYVQFMSLWVVLEKIINKSFKRLSKERILDVAKKKNSLLNKRTVDHIKDIDNGFLESVDKMKFNIMDRLLVSTSAAGIELDDETISLFKQTKKTRDGLHSSVSENGSFPTESIYKILRRVCG